MMSAHVPNVDELRAIAARANTEKKTKRQAQRAERDTLLNVRKNEIIAELQELIPLKTKEAAHEGRSDVCVYILGAHTHETLSKGIKIFGDDTVKLWKEAWYHIARSPEYSQFTFTAEERQNPNTDIRTIDIHFVLRW